MLSQCLLNTNNKAFLFFPIQLVSRNQRIRSQPSSFYFEVSTSHGERRLTPKVQTLMNTTIGHSTCLHSSKRRVFLARLMKNRTNGRPKLTLRKPPCGQRPSTTSSSPLEVTTTPLLKASTTNNLDYSGKRYGMSIFEIPPLINLNLWKNSQISNILTERMPTPSSNAGTTSTTVSGLWEFYMTMRLAFSDSSRGLPPSFQGIYDNIILTGGQDIMNLRRIIRQFSSRLGAPRGSVLRMGGKKKGKLEKLNCNYCRRSGHLRKHCKARNQDESLGFYLPQRDAPWRAVMEEKIQAWIDKAVQIALSKLKKKHGKEEAEFHLMNKDDDDANPLEEPLDDGDYNLSKELMTNSMMILMMASPFTLSLRITSLSFFFSLHT